MIELSIPGRGIIQLEHLVCDVNGTLAFDGRLIEGVSRRLQRLKDRLQIHMITADTHGRQKEIDEQLNLVAERLSHGSEAEQKAGFVQRLGAEKVVALGQGANDAEMLRTAAIGIAILSKEGLAAETLLASDLLVPDILTALDLIENPIRIVASLRK